MITWRVLGTAGLFALTGLAPATSLARHGPRPVSCAELTQDSLRLPNPTTTIVSATLTGATAAVPEHCDVVGKMDERISAVDQQTYAIKFRLRLPTKWNGRLYFMGGGGFNGVVADALGTFPLSVPGNALSRGYAVVATDSGHDNANFAPIGNIDPTWNLVGHFGFDPQARVDFGYRSYDEVTKAAKALIRGFYGRKPDKSYYVGCSEGGREGFMLSQRFPWHFDGILAGAPGAQAPGAATDDIYIVQTLADIARANGQYDPNGFPFLNKTFTDADLQLLRSHLLATCDELDGVSDGMTANFRACGRVLSFQSLQCAGAKLPTCLSAEQVTALKKLSVDARNASGFQVYPNWIWDHGFIQGAVRPSWLGAYDAPQNSGTAVTFIGGLAMPSVFTTPPTRIDLTVMNGAQAVEYAFNFNLDTDTRKGFVTSGIYTESVHSYMDATSTDLDQFRRYGGKLLIYSGQSDGLVPLSTLTEWWERVDEKSRGSNGHRHKKDRSGGAADFVRLFAVPGMAHCTGGPGTDQFAAFDALEKWVEHGKAPDRIVATARADNADNPWPGRTRPLCPYPRYAHYVGSGSVEDAKNFLCTKTR